MVSDVENKKLFERLREMKMGQLSWKAIELFGTHYFAPGSTRL
jgi:hypothetical protein